jgi:hypothetical protein
MAKVNKSLMQWKVSGKNIGSTSIFMSNNASLI